MASRMLSALQCIGRGGLEFLEALTANSPDFCDRFSFSDVLLFVAKNETHSGYFIFLHVSHTHSYRCVILTQYLALIERTYTAYS